MDNGSVRAASTLELRRIASELSLELGEEVVPISLMHSDKVAIEALDGVAAKTWAGFLDQVVDSEIEEVRVLPLFFGPTTALTRRVPAIAAERLGKGSQLSIELADPLVKVCDENDTGLADLLSEEVSGILDTNTFEEMPAVLLVDHGSPSREVADCRDLVAQQMGETLNGKVSGVVACSMERRDGQAYDFCDPLLEAALEEARERGAKRVILSLMFFSPGRHAGPEGDIEEICRKSAFAASGGEVVCCDLVGKIPGLIGLLLRRYRQKWKSAL